MQAEKWQRSRCDSIVSAIVGRAIANCSLKLYRRQGRVQVCKQARGGSCQKPGAAQLGFNPSPVGDFVDFQNAKRRVAPRRGMPMRSKMDLSIHRLKALSFRFSVTAIAFLNVGSADSICVAVSEKNFICATISPHPQNRIVCITDIKVSRFNACTIFHR